MSDDETNIIEKWFPNCEFDSNLQKSVATIFATLFESYVNDKDTVLSHAQHLQACRPPGGPLVIFNQATLSNTELWASSLEQLVKFGFAQDPVLARTARRPMKIAHTLYPGDDHKAQRAQAVVAIEQYFLAERYKSNGRRQVQATTVPSPMGAGPSTRQSPRINPATSPGHYQGPSFPQGSNVVSPSHLQNSPMLMYNSLVSQANQLWNQMQRSSQPIPTNLPAVSRPQFVTHPLQMNYGFQTPTGSPTQPQVRTQIPLQLPHQPIHLASNPTGISDSRQNFQNVSYRNNGDTRNNDSQHYNSRNATNVSYRFKMKDSKYSGADEENIQDFLTQYELVSRDLGLSPEEMMQYFHNLFRDEALRYYHSYVSQNARDVDTASRLMREQFHSISKQQCVKAELGSLLFKDFLKKADGDRRKAMRSLMSHIETRLPLCPENWRHETNKVDFLRQAMLSEQWALPSLYKISSETKFRSLYTELANSLQVHEEAKAQSAINQALPDSKKPSVEHHLGTKPEILFTAPRYANKITKALFPGSEQDRSCWNCGKNGHRFPRCRLPLNAATIAARKAKFYEKKNNTRNGSKHVLYEMALGVNNLLNEDADTDDEVANTYFLDTNESDTEDDEPTEKHVHFNDVKDIIELPEESSTSDMDF